MRKSQFFMSLLIIMLLLNSNVVFAVLTCPTCNETDVKCKCAKIKCDICGTEVSPAMLTKHTELCQKDEGNNKDSKGLSEEEGKELLTQINTSMNRSADYTTLMTVYAALSSVGYSDYECAAILVNMNRECSIRPDAEQSGSGGAIGLIQWDGGRRNTLESFSIAMGDTQYTLKGFKVGGIATQVAFLLAEFEGTSDPIKVDKQWGGTAPSEYSIDLTAATQAVNDTSINLSEKVDLATWRSMTNPTAMSMYFTSQMERCSYDIDIFTEGAKQAPDMYKLLTGTDVGSIDLDDNLANSLGSALIQSKLMDENELSAYISLCEDNIDEKYLRNALRSTLSQDELSNLSDWENNIENDMEEDGWIALLRKLVMLVGILFTVWMLLIYISYWFDKLNTFFDLDLLGILTFGMLHISDTEEECTFHLKDLGTETSNGKTVNHRAILTIVMIGLAFGVLLISGVFYTFVAMIVNSVRNFLG